MLLSVLVYAALSAMAIGAASLVKPLRFLGLASRREGALVLAAGFAAALLAVAWPASTRRASGATRLDRLAPEWQFGERHALHVAATPARVDAAIRAVTADEIFLFRTLTAIRRFGRRGGESILNAPSSRPLLYVATHSGFVWLADEPRTEMVIGARVAPDAHALMNFVLSDDGRGGCDLSTETRVVAKTAAARRSFAVYWRLIHPGSDLIRRSWLGAIRRRAEGGDAPASGPERYRG